MLPSFHEFFINDLASVVFASFDMNGFLDDSVRAAAQGLTGAVLGNGDKESMLIEESNTGTYLTWHGLRLSGRRH